MKAIAHSRTAAALYDFLKLVAAKAMARITSMMMKVSFTQKELRRMRCSRYSNFRVSAGVVWEFCWGVRTDS